MAVLTLLLALSSSPDSIAVHVLPSDNSYEILVENFGRGWMIIYDSGGHPISELPIVNGRAVRKCNLNLEGDDYYYILLDSTQKVVDKGILK